MSQSNGCAACLNYRWLVYRVDQEGCDLWHCACMPCPACNRGQSMPPPYRERITVVKGTHADHDREAPVLPGLL